MTSPSIRPDSGADELVIRRATEADRPAIIDLCRASLGWRDGDPNEAFFSWKHDDNSFGPSPSWVAEAADGQLAGLRVFLRWRFRRPDGSSFDAVRAVDTATHPDWQGRGIFTRLTLGALPDLEADGVANVFNTPNDKSRPGYLKMGWVELGRAPVAVRLRSPRSALRLTSARTGAQKWSEETEVGLDAASVFADGALTERLLSAAADPAGIATDVTATFLRWRYSFAPLRYRVVPLGDSIEDGVVVFRIRRRGDAIEATICDVIAPAGARSSAAIGWILRSTGADFALIAPRTSAGRSGAIPADRLGPVLTWRTLADPAVPALRDLDLVLGDVELF